MKLTRRTVVQAVAESVYGTDPGTGYTGLLARTGTQIQVQGDQITRDTLRDTLSPRGHVIGLKGQTITLPLELRGAGMTGSTLNVPELDALLKACSMAREDGGVIAVDNVSGTFVRGETLTNTTDSNTVGTIADIDGTTIYVRDLGTMPADNDSLSGGTSSATADVNGTPVNAYVYRPDSPNPDSAGSATVQYFVDGIRHVCVGARGTFTMNLEVGQIPQISFTLSTLYAAPTDVTNATPTYLSLVPSPVLGASLTIGSLDVSTVAVNAATFDLGNTVTSRDDIQAAAGRKGYIITGRAPTGSIDPEATTLANFNPYTDWEAANSVAMAVGIGSAAGSRVRIIMPATQYTELPYGDRNGIVTYQLGFQATGDDDEVLLFFS